mmetsp:Transcript_14159/g.18456  ORF Transcript_14159/g.18456 Transcript_14159/m.18456 type:complete len:209 (+) Transcript_14159:135-761(+)|eukprot:CAMPEP_0198154930 /NCGR_PEP_ID=MMETSP1443-20131203/68862_1 /TAXON_ID=186043 /ORGANISM="Entomoneis sp., Strain CCMP2396" /LENGTH=208 /DNA_ID=CAMNT_0043821647 /DNA_START=711 /DNA_END=1337 /DNA_ORIENTATION=+
MATQSVADDETYYGEATTTGILNRVFDSCSDNPKASIHRAWGLTLLFLLFFFILSIVEMMNLRSSEGSTALMMASVITGIVHIILGILGTFVLKRFPTSFSVGFFLGVLVILANQNMILTGIFFGYKHGSLQTNRIFANLGFCLFLVLVFFSVMLFHFKGEIVVASIDTKHHNRINPALSGAAGLATDEGTASSQEKSADYSRFDEAP